MSQSRRSRRSRMEALEDRAAPSASLVHTVTINPPPPSAAPTQEVLVPVNACHGIFHDGKAGGIVTCSI
jgi:hypothetical protein